MKKIKRIIFTLLLLVGIPFFINAQNSMGMLEEDDRYDNVEQLSYGMDFSAKTPVFSLKDHCPPIKSQGNIGSCVGWSSGYYALTIAYAYKNEITDPVKIAKLSHSAMYIYNQIKVASCSSGSRITDAMQLLLDQGDCFHSDFDVQDCSINPDESLRKSASVFKVKDYGTLFSRDAHPDNKIANTISSVEAGKPVVIGMLVTPSFKYHLGSKWIPTEDVTANIGGHAMCVIGYNEYEKTFEIVNSWGTDWGDNGFFTISYDDFAKFVKYGYSFGVEARTNPTDPITLEGTFAFKKFEKWDADLEKPIFSEEPASIRDGVYTLRDGTVKKDEYFKLEAREVQEDTYIYAFSVKPDNNVEILYPTNKAFDSQTDGFAVKQLPKVVNTNVVLSIPTGEGQALQTDQDGTDHLCILYSSERIDDIQNVVKEVASNTGSFEERLQGALGNRLMSSTAIDYGNTGTMKLTASSTQGTIAPIILKIKVGS